MGEYLYVGCILKMELSKGKRSWSIGTISFLTFALHKTWGVREKGFVAALNLFLSPPAFLLLLFSLSSPGTASTSLELKHWWQIHPLLLLSLRFLSFGTNRHAFFSQWCDKCWELSLVLQNHQANYEYHFHSSTFSNVTLKSAMVGVFPLETLANLSHQNFFLLEFWVTNKAIGLELTPD